MKLDPATLTRADKLNLIYRHTHPDYKGGGKGVFRTILVYRGGTALVLLEHLTDAEIEDKLAYALKKEGERRNKPAYYAPSENAMRNGTAFRVAPRGMYARYINGDYIGDVSEIPHTVVPFTKKRSQSPPPRRHGRQRRLLTLHPSTTHPP